MPATGERVKCRCGMTMDTTPGGGKYCENCDTAQPQEAFGIERRKTTYDVRFDTHWVRVIRAEYTDNRTDKTDPIVGIPNDSDEPEETPNE